MKSLYMRLLSLLFVLLISAAPALAVRTDITAVSPKNPNSTTAADSADVVLTAADTSNLNAVALTGREMVYVTNSGASPYTCTFTSVADDFGRTGDITTYSLAAGESALFGPFTTKGWQQSSDGKLYFQGSNAAVKFLVIKIPVGL